MTLSTIQVLEKAAELGLSLAIQTPDRLTYQPLEKCPPAFVDTLREYKTRLLALLQLPFVMVYSQILEETIFFCEDEKTKAALVNAGQMSGASTRRPSCAFSWRTTALRHSLTLNCAKSMRSNARSTGGSHHEP